MQAEGIGTLDHNGKRLTSGEELRTVSEEAAAIRRAHAEKKISATEAATRLTDLKRRYASLLDMVLAF